MSDQSTRMYSGQIEGEKTRPIHRGPVTLAWLVIITEPQAGRLFQLSPSSPTVIGRNLKNDITLIDPTVSDMHAKIKVDIGADTKPVYLLFDLASENGTTVNDTAAMGSPLIDGDHIKMGNTELVFKQV